MSGNISGYITPVKSDGTDAVGAGKGLFTLTAGTTYYVNCGGADALVVGMHLSWPSTLVITTATVEDCNVPNADVTDHSSTVGDWIDENPTTAFVGVVGTGVSQTNGVVAATGDAGGGGCFFHIANTGAKRTRIKIVVGATGGTIRCAVHGKS